MEDSKIAAGIVRVSVAGRRARDWGNVYLTGTLNRPANTRNFATSYSTFRVKLSLWVSDPLVAVTTTV